MKDKRNHILGQEEFIDKVLSCPKCGTANHRHSIAARTVLGVGGKMLLKVARYYCMGCRKFHVHSGPRVYARTGFRYNHEVVAAAQTLLRQFKLVPAAAKLSELCGYYISPTTIYDWQNLEPQNAV